MILKGGINALFYPVEATHSLYLQEVRGSRRYLLKALSNISKHGILDTKKLENDLITVTSIGVRDVEFTCRVHFERLPQEIKKCI
jgi:hypothetical protein